jgi:ribosomal protein S6--L-glutamate ligase
VVDYVADNVKYPELDVRQRLTVSRGYGVVELLIGTEMALVGKSIHDSGLRDRDIIVLSLSRGGKIIPNPKSTRELLEGDRLVCFAKLANVQDLLPPALKKRRRRPLGAHPDRKHG